MILTATRVELAKVFRKWRTYIAFIVIGLLIPVVIIAMGAEGNAYFGFATQMLQNLFTFTGNLMNGYTVSYTLLGTLYVLLGDAAAPRRTASLGLAPAERTLRGAAACSPEGPPHRAARLGSAGS